MGKTTQQAEFESNRKLKSEKASIIEHKNVDNF